MKVSVTDARHRCLWLEAIDIIDALGGPFIALGIEKVVRLEPTGLVEQDAQRRRHPSGY